MFVDDRRSAGVVCVACALTAVAMWSGSAAAELHDRGHGLIYDSARGITWLQDANYARTSGFDADGQMNLAVARSFANNLVYSGFDDWLLPRVHSGSYEHDLETLLEVSLLNPHNGTTPLPNPGPFVNFETQIGYWHPGAGAWSTQTWYWIYDDPWQSHGHYYGELGGYYIPWPIRLGDVQGQIPTDYDNGLHGGSFDTFSGWSVTGGGSAELVDRHGGNMVKLTTGSPVNLKQKLDTPVAEFILSYDLDMSETWGQDLYVYLNHVLIDTVWNTTAGLVHREVPVTDPALLGLDEVELCFTVDYSSAGKVAYLDNIAIVPEPTSGVVAVAAIGGLALSRRRRRPGAV
jgi:MYXO-CTERM domain-containing protein